MPPRKSLTHLALIPDALTSNTWPPSKPPICRRNSSPIQREMEDYARGYGLDFFPTIFEFVDADQLNAIAA